ncbi:hypothetical protein [Streptomyces sp. NPDC087437]|uniref:hypothetical protein n=1 Tax=Streptomyces sp. NPDC087437 TaxID=3365789 RepID=UPI00382E2716
MREAVGERIGQAAITPRHLGLRAVAAKSYARIHWQNLPTSASRRWSLTIRATTTASTVVTGYGWRASTRPWHPELSPCCGCTTSPRPRPIRSATACPTAAGVLAGGTIAALAREEQ